MNVPNQDYALYFVLAAAAVVVLMFTLLAIACI